jgi:hypothetical protein
MFRPCPPELKRIRREFKDAFKCRPLVLCTIFKVFSFSFPKGDVVEDVPTLSARIEEKQKRIENRKGLRAYKNQERQ